MKPGIIAASMLIGAASLLPISANAQAVKAEQSAKNAIGPSNAMGNAPARAVDAKINSAHALPMPQNAVPQAGALPERKWGEPKSSALAPMTSVQAKGEAMPSPLPLR